MAESPISTSPQAYMGIINPLINKARGFLEAGKKLQAMPLEWVLRPDKMHQRMRSSTSTELQAHRPMR